MHAHNNRLMVAVIFFALIGFADSTYLTASHYLNRIPPCTVIRGCERVLVSSYAQIGSVPTAAFGVLFYVMVIVLALLVMYTREYWVIRALSIWAHLGFATSLVFLYLQIAVIGAICQYCLVSLGTSMGIWLGTLLYKRKVVV